MWKRGYRSLIAGERTVGHLVLFLIRLYWGILLIVTGFGKLMNFGHAAEMYANMGLPLPHLSAFVSSTVEFLGGISLVLGFFTPIMTLLLTINFIVAYFVAHSQSFFSLAQFVAQEPFMYLLTSLLVLGFGPGMISIDYWRKK